MSDIKKIRLDGVEYEIAGSGESGNVKAENVSVDLIDESTSNAQTILDKMPVITIDTDTLVIKDLNNPIIDNTDMLAQEYSSTVNTSTEPTAYAKDNKCDFTLVNKDIILETEYVTLLWTNSDSNASFDAQTISLDLSKYESILVDCRFHKTQDSYEKIYGIGKINTTAITASDAITNTMYGSFRSFKATEIGVEFYDGHGSGNSKTETDLSALAIPLHIYGIVRTGSLSDDKIKSIRLNNIKYNLNGEGGTTVVPNPETTGDEDNLSSIQIGEDKFKIAAGGISATIEEGEKNILVFSGEGSSGSGSGYIETVLWEGEQKSGTITLNNSIDNYDMLLFVSDLYNNRNIYTGITRSKQLVTNYRFLYSYAETNDHITATEISYVDSITLNLRTYFTGWLADDGRGLIKIYGIKFNGGSSSSGHTYSIDEKVVGKWIDDKPIYEKTFSIIGTMLDTGNATNSKYVLEDLTTEGTCESLIAYNGYFQLESTNGDIVLYNIQTNEVDWDLKNSLASRMSITNGNINVYIVCNSYFKKKNVPINVAIQYTKTTD